ncbi:MAG: glucose 1-dehydrogenase [Candidatus Omnitrophota bacterium]|nr:glucose 1-dehydrogenase [Candidatus Omnitrophota bacterium]
MKDKTETFDIEISQNMVDIFVGLTADSSSLHTDGKFARRSLYRSNVVHGMLPVAFISLIPSLAGFKDFYFQKISARFVKPVFIGDTISVSYKIPLEPQADGSFEVEYSMAKAASAMVVTTGLFVFKLGEKGSGISEGVDCSGNTMIVTNLTENSWSFEQINKGLFDEFTFLIGSPQIRKFNKILQEGICSKKRVDFLPKAESLLNLMGTCLLSTFVGLCIPGQRATFIDFSISFSSNLKLGCKYRLKGRVDFKSESTRTLVENIEIVSSDCIYAIAKVKVQVQEGPRKMPSVNELQEKHLDLQLKGKVVLITGASRGIGETTAKLFALQGAKVIINYFKGKQDSEKIVHEIKSQGCEVLALQADVSNRDQVKKMVAAAIKHYGKIDILVNNAVRDSLPADFMDLTWDDFQKDIDINLKGAFNCCQEVVPAMIKNKAGKIINIITVYADNPPPKQAKYVVSKSALVGLSRSLAVELAPYNIQVNMVSPGIVETDLTKHVPKMYWDKIKNETPMQRNALPEDVAKAVVFLASSLASFTTGQKIMVTGGNAPFL